MKYLNIIILFLFLGMAVVCHADTIILKDGGRLKGVIVEAYEDRIIMSMEGGEQVIMMNKVKQIIYDLEEQNLTSLADLYLDKRMHKNAYYYYKKALEVNSDYEPARDGMNYVSTLIRQSGRMAKVNYIQMKNEEKAWQQGMKAPEEENTEDKLKEKLGIIIENVKESFQIAGVVPNSPASRAGMKKDDILLAIWGRAIKYMQPEEVMEKLVDPNVMDIKVTIARSYMINMPAGFGDVLGMKLGYAKMEGLLLKKLTPGGLAEKAGLKEKDIIPEIQGESTRYMPYSEVERIIASRKGETLSLRIQRDMAIWKKFRED